MNKKDQQFMVQKIRAQYMEKEKDNRIDALRKLDAKVKRPASVLAYTLGTISTLIFGTGMCLSMGVIESGSYYGLTIGEDMMVQGVAIGLIGMAFMVINYPVYKKILGDRIARYGEEIIRVSEEILSNQE